MKLVQCSVCGDLFNLTGIEKQCSCGKSSGLYINGIDAWVRGPVLVLGISNPSYDKARERHNKQPNMERGWRFEAFIIPKNAPTVRRLD